MLAPRSTCIDRTAPTLVLVDPIGLASVVGGGANASNNCWGVVEILEFLKKNAAQLVTIQGKKLPLATF